MPRNGQSGQSLSPQDRSEGREKVQAHADTGTGADDGSGARGKENTEEEITMRKTSVRLKGALARVAKQERRVSLYRWTRTATEINGFVKSQLKGHTQEEAIEILKEVSHFAGDTLLWLVKKTPRRAEEMFGITKTEKTIH
jgi:hypothetical protein